MTQPPIPSIDGITPAGVEASAAKTTVWCPPSTHRDHGDRVYFVVEAHVADVAHPEIVEDGLRVGVRRVEKLKADGAWLIGEVEGGALTKLLMRRRQLHDRGGAVEMLPDTELRDEIRDGLAHLADEAGALFAGAPDDPRDLGEGGRD